MPQAVCLRVRRDSGIRSFNMARDVEMMQQDAALAAFAALSQEHRLQIVRLLVQAGPDGLRAGDPGEKRAAGSSNRCRDLPGTGSSVPC